MRKTVLIAASIFVLSATPAFGIYREGEVQPTPKDGEMMLMSTTAEEGESEDTTTTTTATDRMEAKSTMKAAMSEARTAFKEKMQGIKDAKKLKIVEGLDTRINEMNKKKTTWMTERLTRLSSILSKFTTTGDPDDVVDATAAIEAAKTAVTAQAAKDYVLEVTTETALKTNARALIKEFITDMKAVNEKIRLATVAVAKVAKATVTVTPTAADE